MEQNNLVFEVDGLIYELIYNFKDAFQREAFEEKLVDVLKNKPYIVGDISHDKLRLSGFILTKDGNNPKNINNLEDYILEYCNFGCPYFVVRRLSPNEFIEEIDDKEDIIDKLHDVKIQPTIQDTEKHTQAIDQ